MTHEIKIKPEYYVAVISGKKTFEIRWNDRKYEAGDHVILTEWNEDGPTGRKITITISYVLKDVPQYGLMEGFCIFGWENPPHLGFQTELLTRMLAVDNIQVPEEQRDRIAVDALGQQIMKDLFRDGYISKKNRGTWTEYGLTISVIGRR